MGFDSAKFVTSVADDKKCLLCHEVLDNPVRSPCGHVFCSGCITPYVLKHGQCPQKCRALAPTDLENVLPLREVILNLKVRCEFFDRGCKEAIRLTDLIRHAQRCGFRPVQCSNPGCGAVLPQNDIDNHETETCTCRPVGECDKGCCLMLYQHTADTHDCYQALKALVRTQEEQLSELKEKFALVNTKFCKREKTLLEQVAALNKQLGDQNLVFNKTIKEVKNQQNSQNVADLENEVRDACVDVVICLHVFIYMCSFISLVYANGEFAWRRITLHRDKLGSLGFNIMGGYT
ncbi:E3 ubiquitin-protein ligase PDZRN3-like, partial [Physella acuta]|uniref:E3 ubiquitin-protein ligase PDZRN3-like n=1 Tax=Physella acuta TaxID=109671 RepID=UPI0027DE9D4F